MHSKTSPAYFNLEVFFNYQAAVAVEGQPKAPANALVSTSLMYTGEMLDYPIDMGSNVCTVLHLMNSN